MHFVEVPAHLAPLQPGQLPHPAPGFERRNDEIANARRRGRQEFASSPSKSRRSRGNSPYICTTVRCCFMNGDAGT